MLSTKLLGNTCWLERKVPMDIFHLLRKYVGNTFCPQCASYLSTEDECSRCNSTRMEFIIAVLGCTCGPPTVYDVVTIDQQLVEQITAICKEGETNKNGYIDVEQQMKDRYPSRMKEMIDCFGGLLILNYGMGHHLKFGKSFTETLSKDLISFSFCRGKERKGRERFFHICGCTLTLGFIEKREGLTVDDVIDNVKWMGRNAWRH